MWLSKLLVEFVNMYTIALHRFMENPSLVREDMPLCWKNAFEEAKDKRNPFTVDLVLAMNAHIDHDLAIAVVRVGFAESRSADFYKVEEALTRATNKILTDLGKFDSFHGEDSVGGLTTVMRMGGQYALWISSKLMRIARTNVWNNARDLSKAGNNCGQLGAPSCPALQHIKTFAGRISTIVHSALRFLPTFILNSARSLEATDFKKAIERIVL